MCSISAGFLRQIKLFERLPRVLHLILRKLRKVSAVIGIKSCDGYATWITSRNRKSCGKESGFVP
jgi:hypothetical protein